MSHPIRIVVTSRSFSRHPVLRAELLERYPNTTFNDEGKSLRGTELVQFLKGHDRVILALEQVDDELLSQVPELEVISKVGVGLDNIDLTAVKQRGIHLSWMPGTNSRSVSELVIAQSINLLRHVSKLQLNLRSGTWKQEKGRCLSRKTFGIVGCGYVGRDVARLLKPFECELLVNDPYAPEDFIRDHKIELVSLHKLLACSDIVSLHLPLNDSTMNILSKDKLCMMKESAILINTSRGGLVDEYALSDLLSSGRIAGAALDVFAVEPPGDTQLLELPNVIATPHIGGSTEEAILAMGRAAIAGLDPCKGAVV